MRYIYMIQFPNWKVYIGQTKNLKNRFRAYKTQSSNIYIKNAIKKYRLEKCLIIILSICDDNDVDRLEKHFIKIYNSNNIICGYNLEDGGCKNKHHSNITKLKIGNANRGKRHTNEHIKKIQDKRKLYPAPMLGKKHSIETKIKMSKSRKNKLKNKKYKDILLKSGFKYNGYKPTEEHINKLKIIQTGRKLSKETKEKMRMARINYWHNKKNK